VKLPPPRRSRYSHILMHYTLDQPIVLPHPTSHFPFPSPSELIFHLADQSWSSRFRSGQHAYYNLIRNPLIRNLFYDAVTVFFYFFLFDPCSLAVKMIIYGSAAKVLPHPFWVNESLISRRFISGLPEGSRNILLMGLAKKWGYCTARFPRPEKWV